MCQLSQAGLTMHSMMQHQGEKKQLGIFFFAEQDAQDLKQQVLVLLRADCLDPKKLWCINKQSH